MKCSPLLFEVSEVVVTALIQYRAYLRANLPTSLQTVGYRKDFINDAGRAGIVNRFEGRRADRSKYAVLVPSGLEEIVKDPEGAARATLVAAEREAKKVLESAA